MDNKNRDLDIRSMGLSDPSMDGVDVSGLTVEDILAEARGERPKSAPARAPEPESAVEVEPESTFAPEPEADYAPGAERDFTVAPESDFTVEPETQTEYGDGEEYFEEPTRPVKRRQRRERVRDIEAEEPEDGELFDDEAPEAERGRARRVAEVSTGFLILLGWMVLTLALLFVAVVFDLPDPAWSVLVIASLVMACVPMALDSATGMSQGRIHSGLIMLVAVVVYGLSARLVEATVAAVIFNVLSAVFDSVTAAKLGALSDSLGSSDEPEDPRVTMRRLTCLRNVTDGRVGPVAEQAKAENLICLAALGIAVVFSLIPPLFDGKDFIKWIARGAVVLSLGALCGQAGAAMSYLNAVKTAFSNGVCFAGADVLTDCAGIASVVFNKSGTITDGNFKVKALDPVRISGEQLVYLAAYAGAYSDHALARAIREYAGFEPDRNRILRHRVQPGYGSMAMMDTNQVVGVGNIDFMEKLGVKGDMYIDGDTCVFVSVGRTCVGRIDFTDDLNEGARSIAGALRREKVANVALMTGDNSLRVTNLGREVGITELYSDCRPSDKADRLRYIMTSQEDDEKLMFVSRADEDGELLRLANIGVTLGIGLDATDTFPDVVIPSGKLAVLVKLTRVAKSARKNLTVSFVSALAVRAVCVILALTGTLPLWVAVAVAMAAQFGTLANSNVDVK